jgi:hypothetical protein
MARKKTGHITDPLMQRAISLAQQQYGPQSSTIVRAIRTAGAQRRSTIRQARATGKAGAASEMQTGQEIVGRLGQVNAAAQQNSGYVDSLMAGPDKTSATGPGAAMLAAIGNSRANLPAAVAMQQADATRQAGERASRAREGASYAERAANTTFAGNVSTLRDQLQEVQNNQGLKANTTYQDLLDKASRDARADAGLDIQRTKILDARDKDSYLRANGLGPYKPPKGASKKGWRPSGAARLKTEESVSAWVNAYKRGIDLQKVNKDDPTVKWTLAQAKRGMLGNGHKVSPTTAVKLYEKRIRDNMTQKFGDHLGNAIAQSVTYGGVGLGTQHMVWKKYGVKLPLFSGAGVRAPSKG